MLRQYGANKHNYFEFEINAQNTLFDLFMTKPYRNGGIPLISWNSPGIKHAVSIEGTLNEPTDTDKRFYKAGIRGVFFESDSKKHFTTVKNAGMEAHRWIGDAVAEGVHFFMRKISAVCRNFPSRFQNGR